MLAIPMRIKAVLYFLITFSLILATASESYSQTRPRVGKKPLTQEEINKQKAQQDALAGLTGGNLDTESEIGVSSGFHGIVRSNLKGFQISKENAEKAGLNVLDSARLLLITDMPLDDDMKQWSKYLDQAVFQWAEYFNVRMDRLTTWKIRACVMKDNVPFMMNDLLPMDLPPFQYGFEYGNNVWLFAQPSRDYQRHLFLHECTHAFMNQVMKGCGSLWFGEGLAEYFGTHRIEDGRLTMGIMPKTRNEFPNWGRIRFIQDDIKNGTFIPLNGFFSSELKSQDNRSYSWAWALVWLMNSDPHYKSILQKLSTLPQGNTYRQRVEIINKAFRESFSQEEWSKFSTQWRAYISDLDYGYDMQTSQITDTRAFPLQNTAFKSVKSDKDWQNMGVILQKGKTYTIKASGEYKVSAGEKAWLCQPNGITVKYVRQKPLGILLAALEASDSGESAQLSGFVKPIVVGSQTEFTAEQTGAIWMKINALAGGNPVPGEFISVEISEKK